MSFETAIYNRLSSQMSSALGTRIYPMVAPQKTATPYVVYTKISAGKEYSHAGGASLSRDRVQISVFSTGYLAAKTVVGNIVTAMEGAATFQASFKVNEIDFYEEQTKLFHIPIDFIIWHSL